MRRRFAFLGRDAGFSQATRLDFLRLGRFPNPFRPRVFVAVLGEIFAEPAAAISPRLDFEIAEDFEISARLEGADFFFALGQDRKRGRLHPAHGRKLETARLVVERGHRPRAVDADEPIALRSTDRGFRERNHFFVRAQSVQRGPDRILRHRLQPKAADRFFAAGELDQVAENQFAFAPGVAGIDQIGNVFALDEPLELIKARLRFLDRLQGELVRNDREIRETPFPPLHIQLARETELDEVTDRGRDDVVLVLEVVLDFFEATERASEIVRDAGFLGDDERFGHCRWGKLAGLKNSGTSAVPSSSRRGG